MPPPTARIGALVERSRQRARGQPARAVAGRAAQPADRSAAEADRRAEDALGASETRDRESNTKIADLGRRLNVALAQRVQELNRYRSDFFGRLREILSDRENIRIVGDRFVFQSEVLFASGADEINEAGQVEMKKLADAIIELQKEIPPEINWVLRVDGHTDNKPLSGTGRYRDNWELSIGALDLGRQVPDRQRRARQPAGRRRFRRIPAARRGRHRRGAREEPPHRAEAHRALISAEVSQARLSAAGAVCPNCVQNAAIHTRLWPRTR